MSLRISSPLVMLGLLAGCSDASAPPPGDEVACAIGEGAALASDCIVERERGDAGFVIHHPDGGFRRLARDPATGALAVQDGAEPLVSLPGEGDMLAFAVGADQYRVPAQLFSPKAE